MKNTDCDESRACEKPGTMASPAVDCPGRSGRRRSSILKPPKQRNPLQVLDFNPNADEEQTVNVTRKARRVSFASGTQVKEFVEVHTETASVTVWGSSYERAFANSDSSHQSDNSPEESHTMHIENFEQLIRGTIKIQETDTNDEQMDVHRSTNFLQNVLTASKHCASVKIVTSTGPQASQQESNNIFRSNDGLGKPPGHNSSYSIGHRETFTSESRFTATSSMPLIIGQSDDDMDLTKPVESHLGHLYSAAFFPHLAKDCEETFNGTNASVWSHSSEDKALESGALDLTTKNTASFSTLAKTGACGEIKRELVENSPRNKIVSANKNTLGSIANNTMFFNETGIAGHMDLTEPNGEIYYAASHRLDVSQFEENVDLSEPLEGKLKKCDDGYAACHDENNADLALDSCKHSPFNAVSIESSHNISIELRRQEVATMQNASANKTPYALDLELSETESAFDLKLLTPTTNKTVYADDMELTCAADKDKLTGLIANKTVYADDMELTCAADKDKLSGPIANKTVYADDMELTYAGDDLKLTGLIANKTVYADDMELTYAGDKEKLLHALTMTANADKMDLTETVCNIVQDTVNPNVTLYVDNMEFTEAANVVNVTEAVTNKTDLAGIELTDVADNIRLPCTITNNSIYANNMDLTEAGNNGDIWEDATNNEVAYNIKLSQTVRNTTVYAENMELTESVGNVMLSTANNTVYADDMELTAAADKTQLSEAVVNNSTNISSNGYLDCTKIADPAEFEIKTNAGHLLLKRVPERIFLPKTTKATDSLNEMAFLNNSTSVQLNMSSTNNVLATNIELNFENDCLVRPKACDDCEEAHILDKEDKVCSNLDTSSCTGQEAHSTILHSLSLPQKRCRPMSASLVMDEENTTLTRDVVSPPKKMCQREDLEIPLPCAAILESEVIIDRKTYEGKPCEDDVVTLPKKAATQEPEFSLTLPSFDNVFEDKVHFEETKRKLIQMNVNQLCHSKNLGNQTRAVQEETCIKVEALHCVTIPSMPHTEVLCSSAQDYAIQSTCENDLKVDPVLSHEKINKINAEFASSLHSKTNNTSTGILTKASNPLHATIGQPVADKGVTVSEEVNNSLTPDPVSTEEYNRSLNNSVISNASSNGVLDLNCTRSDGACDISASLMFDASIVHDNKTLPNLGNKSPEYALLNVHLCGDAHLPKENQPLVSFMETSNKQENIIEKDTLHFKNKQVHINRQESDKISSVPGEGTPGIVGAEKPFTTTTSSCGDGLHYSVNNAEPTKMDANSVNCLRLESHNQDDQCAIASVPSPSISVKYQMASECTLAVSEPAREAPALSSQSPAPVTLEDTLWEEALRSKEWCIKELNKEQWMFLFFSQTLELTLTLDSRDGDFERGSVNDIYFRSLCTEKSNDLCKFVHNALMQKFSNVELKCMCPDIHHVQSLISALSDEAHKIFKFFTDFFLLQDLYEMKIVNESFEFTVTNFAIHALFDVSVDLSINWEVVSPHNIIVKQIVGTVDEVEIKQLAKGIPPGPHCLRHYVEEVNAYVRTLERYTAPTLTAEHQ